MGSSPGSMATGRMAEARKRVISAEIWVAEDFRVGCNTYSAARGSSLSLNLYLAFFGKEVYTVYFRATLGQSSPAANIGMN